MTIQEQVAAWHQTALPDATPLQVAKKLLEEASECHCATKAALNKIDYANTIGYLPDATTQDELAWFFRDVVKEAADAAICCYALAAKLNVDLDEVIREKLVELNARGKEQAARDQERGIT